MIVSERCVIGVRVSDARLVKAFDVCIRDQDIYVNYADGSTPEAHVSYHASGELHFKIGGHYAKWTGGPAGKFEPIKFTRTPPGNIVARVEFCPIGWRVSKLETILPPLNSTPDVEIDARSLEPDSILALQVSAVGGSAKFRTSIVGFLILATHRFGSSVRAEIEAFVISEGNAGLPYAEDL